MGNVCCGDRKSGEGDEKGFFDKLGDQMKEVRVVSLSYFMSKHDDVLAQ